LGTELRIDYVLSAGNYIKMISTIINWQLWFTKKSLTYVVPYHIL